MNQMTPATTATDDGDRPVNYNGIPDNFREEWDRLQGMDAEAIEKEIVQLCTLETETLVRMALRVRVLRDRGHDLSHLKLPIMQALMLIAYGQLLPDLYARYAGQYVCRYAMRLPIPEQQKLLEAESIPVAVSVGENGDIDYLKAPIASMSAAQVRQVFAPDKIREPAEQMAWLRSQQRPQIEAPKPEPLPYSISGNKLVVNRPVTFSKRDLLRIVEDL